MQKMCNGCNCLMARGSVFCAHCGVRDVEPGEEVVDATIETAELAVALACISGEHPDDEDSLEEKLGEICEEMSDHYCANEAEFEQLQEDIMRRALEELGGPEDEDPGAAYAREAPGRIESVTVKGQKFHVCQGGGGLGGFNPSTKERRYTGVWSQEIDTPQDEYAAANPEGNSDND